METRPTDDARIQQAQLTDQELSAIRRGPLAAAKLIIEAAPSFGAALQEEKDVAVASLAGAAELSDPASLLGTALRPEPSDAERTYLDTDVAKEELFETLREGIMLISSKASSELTEYRSVLVYVAASVAAAAREVGRRGAGPIISEREDMMLKEIKRVVNV